MNEKKNIFEKNFNLAITNHKNENYQDAINYYNKALEINPEHTECYYNLGLLKLFLKNNLRCLFYYIEYYFLSQ